MPGAKPRVLRLGQKTRLVVCSGQLALVRCAYIDRSAVSSMVFLESIQHRVGSIGLWQNQWFRSKNAITKTTPKFRSLLIITILEAPQYWLATMYHRGLG